MRCIFFLVVYWNLAANSGDDEGAEYALTKVKKFIQDEIESGISVSLDPNEEVLKDVVPAMIDLLKDGGYNLVDADTCLGVPVYDPKDPDLDADLPKKDDDKWKCPKDEGN